MRKYIIVIFALIICFLSSCGYAAHKEYYNEIDDYEKIWQLTGFRHGYEYKSPLFPDDIKNLEINEYYCRYDEQLPLGEGVQILLHITYDDEMFSSEVSRISSLTSQNTEDFVNTNFSAYTVKMGNERSYEYALVDSDERSIYYIFIYALPAKEIEFDKSFLPNNYLDYGLTD